MLQLITGGSGSGKSHWIREKIARLAEDGSQRILLLVPEQYSFESERQIHRLLGAKAAARVEVLSFTRLADAVFREYGGLAGAYADESKKLILMNLALYEIKDSLSYYQKSWNYPSFTGLMLQTVSELKNAGISPQQLEEASHFAEGTDLERKGAELSRIYSVYDALLHKTYLDPQESLERAVKKAKGQGFFAGTSIFVDEFKGFTAGELALLEVMIRESPLVTVSLCMEENENDPGGLYSFVRATRDRLTRIARKAGATVAVPVRISAGKRFASPELAFYERAVLRPAAGAYSGQYRGDVRFAFAQNEYEEVDYALSYLMELVRKEGYRYRDFVILSRDLDRYRHVLESAFYKYEIPYYMDERNPVETKPLIRFVRVFLELACQGITTERVLTLLKCGVTCFTPEEIGELENYCYLWDIRGRGWKEPFTANPAGFSAVMTEEDADLLERFNRIREFVVLGVEEFCGSCGETGSTISTALYDALERMGVPERLEELIESLESQNPVYGEEYARVWEILMELCGNLAETAGEVRLSLIRYRELFELLVQHYDMGTLPQTLDSVTVGNAQRVRTSAPKAAIILGANQGAFPLLPNSNSVFSPQERKLLIDSGLELLDTAEQTIAEERFIAYKALSCASHKLVVTARQADLSGNALRLSELFSQGKALFGEEAVTDAGRQPLLYGCRTPRTAFLKLAEHFRQDTGETAALREYFETDPEFSSGLRQLYDALQPKPFQLSNPQVIKGLFGGRLRLSPSRMETFYQCRFRYFCESGLKAKPRMKAELNPIETGSLIHQVLFALTSSQEYDFVTLTQAELRQAVKRELDAYLETVMGGEEGKTSRFRYLYSRMNRTVFQIASHLQQEFSQSKFRPKDFELELSPDGEVPPLEVVTPDGARVSLIGRVDRVDTYENPATGEKYVRVVDYKSGSKKFSLSDLYYGLNLQMLVYLFCIWKNGRGSYQGMLPAGVLYMPAKAPTPTLAREADEEASKSEEMAQYKMNGLLLSDPELLLAMDAGGQGIFIPAKLNKDGEPDKNASVVTLGEMGRLYQHVCRLAAQMAEELHKGGVEARPVNGLGYDPCAYCDYRSVCGTGPNSPRRELNSLSRETLFEKLKEDEDGAQLD